MNQHARFLAVAAVAALTWVGAPVGAQAVGDADARNELATNAIGTTRTRIIDSLTAVASVPLQSSAVASAATHGPTLASARVASHTVASTTPNLPPVIQNRTSNRNSVALMIVGGAALVVGAVIGGDAGTLVMLGGAGVGLYGLYLFLT